MLIQRTFLFLCILFPLTSKSANQGVATLQQNSLSRSTRVSLCTCCALVLLRLCKKKIDLRHAIWQKNLNDIKLFVFMGGNVNDHINNIPPLVYATIYGHTGDTKQRDILQYLLKQGADVNAVGSDGTSALIAAAENGNYWVLSTLLKAGAKIDHHNRYGQTALYWAVVNATNYRGIANVRHNCLTCIELLIQHGACPKAPPGHISCPKNYAIVSRDWEAIKALRLENDPDVIKAFGSEPL